MHEKMSRGQPGNLTFTVPFMVFESHKMRVAQNEGGSAESPVGERAAEMVDNMQSCSAFMQSCGPRTSGPGASAAIQWKPAPSLCGESGKSIRFAPEVRSQALAEEWWREGEKRG